ncbi:cupin domain-containing protein [Sphingomonas sp. Leaf10]|uniref:cupin domain-containing protein n=1 Tax=Sphingomonas sp. Leaf10 TaxID=1735676 RepID=UPI000ACC0B87|nr:cupin domain-containing protein [Sphingomonas sp. Leaf10]
MMLAALALLIAGQAADRTSFATSAEIAAEVEAMGKAMKPDQGFAWKPVVRDGDRVAALEYWKAPGRPAVHPDQAEYAIVIAGEGTLRSGGTMVGGRQTQPGLIEGDRIDGATERRLRPGDVMLIPAGVPHWFGITGDRLVLLGTKLLAK